VGDIRVMQEPPLSLALLIIAARSLLKTEIFSGYVLVYLDDHLLATGGVMLQELIQRVQRGFQDLGNRGVKRENR
jgi:hypothetical protein